MVSYNTATGQSGTGVQTARVGADVVLEAIGSEDFNGIERPIDVLLLQEQFSMEVSAQSFVDVLNNIYGAGTYARSSLNGVTSSPTGAGGVPGLVYNTQTVELIDERLVGQVGGGNLQPRSTLRYQLRPVGYDASADFYAYNSHYKAGSSSTDSDRREREAILNRVNATQLGEGASIIYAGDFNIATHTQDMYQALLSDGTGQPFDGAGQAFDPINQPGSWGNNSSFAEWHTQAPCEFSCNGLTSGGVDDRFDFQLVSGELLDNEGLSYIPGSYHTFANNGSTFNDAINVGNTITFPSIAEFTKTEILDALVTASDHLPVVADYQLPALMLAEEDFMLTEPLQISLGESISLPYRITNDAPVDVFKGADELDYEYLASGDLMGSGSGSLLATLLGDVVMVSLDSSTLGAKSGTVTFTSNSDGDPFGEIALDLSWEVITGGLAGDYDGNGIVDASDYTVWRDTLGMTVTSGTGADGDSNGMIEVADYNIWRTNFGNSSAASLAVPEPMSAVVLSFLMAACLGFRAQRRQ